MRNLIVKKFGGTSVGIADRLRSLVRIVSVAKADHDQVIVVSAVSGQTKEEGTTSLLLKCLEAKANGLSPEHHIASIRLQHSDLIGGICDPHKSNFSLTLDAELDKLRVMLASVGPDSVLTPPFLDSVLSIGERLSAYLVESAFLSSGVDARVCDLSGALAESEEGTPNHFYNQVAKTLSKLASPIREEVVVCTGFFGVFPGGLLENVGRGYSDLCAALIARGFGRDRVSELQVWKEVDGVFTADPRKVPHAKVLHEISATEAAELTFFGSEVLHPYTMEQVISQGIPIKVLNSLKPELPGTRILPERFGIEDIPTAVTVKRGVVTLSVTSNRMYDAKGFLAKLFEVLKDNDLIVDLVSTSEVTVSCTVRSAVKLRNAIPELSKLGEILISENQAILSVVGEGIYNSEKIPGTMFSAMSNAGIKPEMITQAASRRSISCVVSEAVVEKALLDIHEAFFPSQLK